MGLTITEKILLAHTDKKDIVRGEFIEAKVDLALGNDITAPLAIEEFRKSGKEKVFNRKRIALVPDHFTPNKDIRSAQQCKFLREFAKEQRIENYFELGEVGIEHVLLPERGMVHPGDLIIGADSHTCTYGAVGAFSTGVGSTDLAAVMVLGRCWLRVPETMKFVYYGRRPKWVRGKDLILHTIGNIGVDGALYKSMEFCGESITKLPIEDRFTMCNMAVEAGAKNGIIEPDEVTFDYMKKVAPKKRFSIYKSDKDAEYCEVREYDITKLEPQVACPHLPSNVKPVRDVRGVKLDQVVIGSCTNGWLTDLRLAANILKGRKVHPGLRLIIIPATQGIYMAALKEHLIEIFVKAGGVVSAPTCGPCLGGHMGILAEGERALATTNRNFVGRMGHPKSEVYLSNPLVAAASAIKGRIVHPEEVVG